MCLCGRDTLDNWDAAKVPPVLGALCFGYAATTLRGADPGISSFFKVITSPKRWAIRYDHISVAQRGTKSPKKMFLLRCLSGLSHSHPCQGKVVMLCATPGGTEESQLRQQLQHEDGCERDGFAVSVPSDLKKSSAKQVLIVSVSEFPSESARFIHYQPLLFFGTFTWQSEITHLWMVFKRVPLQHVGFPFPDSCARVYPSLTSVSFNCNFLVLGISWQSAGVGARITVAAKNHLFIPLL